MRKVTTLLLLLAFVVNGAGYLKTYRFMYAKKSAARKAYLRQQKVLQIATSGGLAELASRGFEPKKKGEYVYRGKRYDVIKTAAKGDATIIYLARDSYEEELLSFLQSFFNPAAAAPQDPATAQLKHDLLKQYLPSPAPLFLAINNGRDIMGQNAHFVPQMPFIEVSPPPPQRLS